MIELTATAADYPTYIAADTDSFTINYVNPCHTASLLVSAINDVVLNVFDPQVADVPFTFGIDNLNCGSVTATTSNVGGFLGVTIDNGAGTGSYSFPLLEDGTFDSLFDADPTPEITLTISSDDYPGYIAPITETFELIYSNPCHIATLTATAPNDFTLTVFETPETISAY